LVEEQDDEELDDAIDVRWDMVAVENGWPLKPTTTA
jgi:hypothetical protein